MQAQLALAQAAVEALQKEAYDKEQQEAIQG